MKKLIALIGVAFIATVSQAQIGQDAFNFVFTNSAVDVEAFRGLTDNKYIVAFTYVKDITTNAGVLLTYDKCFTPGRPMDNQTDELNGGFTLRTSFYPLSKWNPNSKVKLTVGGYEEAGVITGGPNDGTPVNVVGAYIDYQYKSLEVGFLYQNRTETGLYAGNYIGVHAGWRF